MIYLLLNLSCLNYSIKQFEIAQIVLILFGFLSLSCHNYSIIKIFDIRKQTEKRVFFHSYHVIASEKINKDIKTLNNSNDYNSLFLINL